MIQLPELFQCFFSVSNGMAEDAFSSYSHLYIILLAAGMENPCLICERGLHNLYDPR